MRKSITALLTLAIFVMAPMLFMGAFGWGGHAPVTVNAGNGQPDIHSGSGNHRIVMINGQILVLAPMEYESRGDRTFRSLDSGVTFTEVDSFAQYSGCMVSGKDSLVYHIWGDFGNDSMHYKYFKYNNSTPLNLARKHVYYHADLSNTGISSPYRETSCAVDSNGVVYAITNWATGADPTHDRVWAFFLKDTNAGWQGPYQVSSNNTEANNYPQIEVAVDNAVIATFTSADASNSYFCRSTDTAKTWTCGTTATPDGAGRFFSNASPLAYAQDTILIFGQRAGGTDDGSLGLNYMMSTNNGTSFGSQTLLEHTCGYADPSAAVDSLGRIYIGYRSSLNVSGTLSGTDCGDSSFSKMGWINPRLGDYSIANVDSAYPNTYHRVGTRIVTRYQNWYNYGGIMVWSWMGFQDVSGTNRPLLVDVNDTVKIMSTHVLASASKTAKFNTSIKLFGKKFWGYFR